MFVILDNFSKYFWAMPLKSKDSQTITNEFSNILQPQKENLSK